MAENSNAIFISDDLKNFLDQKKIDIKIKRKETVYVPGVLMEYLNGNKNFVKEFNSFLKNNRKA